MSAPAWVPLAAIIIIHDRQIARHGGAPGMRDRACLEMGCARATNLAADTDAGLEGIAAAYAFGIARARAFVDGNKRTAFVTATTFLRMNGHAFRPDPVEGVRKTIDLATEQVDERAFADWVSSQYQRI